MSVSAHDSVSSIIFFLFVCLLSAHQFGLEYFGPCSVLLYFVQKMRLSAVVLPLLLLVGELRQAAGASYRIGAQNYDLAWTSALDSEAIPWTRCDALGTMDSQLFVIGKSATDPARNVNQTTCVWTSIDGSAWTSHGAVQPYQLFNQRWCVPIVCVVFMMRAGNSELPRSAIDCLSSEGETYRSEASNYSTTCTSRPTSVPHSRLCLWVM